MSEPTIRDVARVAGVSIKSVSRAINGEPKVSDETRARILAAAQSLGYRPNLAARNLASGRSFVIALMFDNPANDYVSELERGAMTVCREAGYHLVVEELSEGRVDRTQRFEDLLRRLHPDGAILTPPLCDDLALLGLLERFGVPYVRVTPARDPARGSSVYIDDRAAAEAMARELLRLGHRRLGFIAGPAEHIAALQRRQGFLDAIAACGEAATYQLETGAFTFRSGLEAAGRLLAAPLRPTAIFAGNDDMALGVLAEAHRLGVRVPDELSVVGFDDSPIAQVVWPQLTTVRQPLREMAEAAAAMLVARPAPAGGLRQKLDFEIVVRGSCGPAADTTPAE